MNLWNYKTFCYLIGAYLVGSVFVNALSVWDIKAFTPGLSGFVNYGMILMHMGITTSVITTLKRYKESRWRLLAMYVLLAEEIIMSVISVMLKNGDKHTLINFYAAVMILDVFFCLYVLISSLLVKNRQIAGYFKLYGICLIVGVVGIVIVQFAFVYYRIPTIWYSPTCALLFKLHTLPLLVMYINLYNKNFKFRAGDLIVAKNEMIGVPAGSHGTVVAKHGNYYEVEFFDENETLLDTLTVSTKDIDFAQELDLRSRVEAFGN